MARHRNLLHPFFVMTYMEDNPEKKDICIYRADSLWLFHSAAQQKLMQHCKQLHPVRKLFRKELHQSVKHISFYVMVNKFLLHKPKADQHKEGSLAKKPVWKTIVWAHLNQECDTCPCLPGLTQDISVFVPVVSCYEH